MRIKDDEEIKNILKLMSPGTALREGLDNILRAKTGGLVAARISYYFMLFYFFSIMLRKGINTFFVKILV